MKQIPIIFFCIVCSFNVYSVSAQIFTDTSLFNVKYEVSYVPDSTNKSVVKKEIAVLTINKRSSIFKTETSLINDSIRTEVLNQVNFDLKNINMGGIKKGGINIDLVKFYDSRHIMSRERIVNNYLVQDSMVKINWQILDDTTEIKSLHCQKAIGNFRGRTYTVWFCPNLPFRDGPWKLHGLPGLIVDVSDSKNEVFFKISSFERVIPNKGISIDYSLDKLAVTYNDFFGFKKAYSANPAGFIEAQFLKSEAEGGSIVYPPGYKFKVPNNSFELSKD